MNTFWQFAIKNPGLILFNLVYAVGFGGYYLLIRNYEFLWYVAVLVFFFVLIAATINKTKFNSAILWMLSVWGLLHMAGGGVQVGSDVLYALVIIPFVELGDSFVLKYDQVVHFYGFFISTFVVYHLLVPYLKNNVKSKTPIFISALAGAGLGALNEIVEFTAVVFVADTGVGGYFNTALDLVFNMLGAITAAFILLYLSKKKTVGIETEKTPTL